MPAFDFVREHQLDIMLSLGNVCGAVAFSILLGGMRGRRRKILFFLELCASLLLISDRYIWLYEGDTSAKGLWMTRINTILCYEMILMVFLTINLYLRELFRESRDLDPHLKRFRLNNIILVGGAVLTFVFQFTDLYYYFDETNTYQEGLLYPFFTFLPFVALVVDISLIIQFYRKLQKNVRISLLIFAIIPFIDPLVQMALPGLDSTDMSFTFMAMVLYSIDLVNTNKAAESAMRAMALSEAKSAFLSNMSHEIRTPLNSVLGMNEMVLRECDDPKIIGYSENIRSAGTTLLGLINDILDFSKIEAGKIEIIPVDYDLSSLINDLVSMIRPRAEMKGLELILDIDERTPKLLNGDEIRIKQIITNILTNAVKYTERGSVTLHVGYEQSEDPDQIDLHVSVRDTGIGMKEEDLKKLFAKFERIDEKRNRNIEGTGLGMNITKSLLESMGSAIEVESRPGEGSTFSFRLKQKVVGKEPIGDFAAAIRESLHAHEKYAEKIYAPDARILIVDDNAMNLEVFRNLIKLTGIQTDTADSGAQCLKKSLEQKYDLILLDHMMPGMDGIETLKQMREQADDKNHETPVICLTANAISGARAQYIAAGFSDYLTKPIEYDKLEEMLVRYLPQEKVKFEQAESQNAKETAEGTSEIPPELLELEKEGIIDVSAGIGFCGTAENYLAVFQLFYQELGDKVTELETLHDAGNLTDYTTKVHAMKSSLRTIGANAPAEAAKLLEDAGKADDAAYIDAHHQEFVDAMKELKEQLSRVPMEEQTDAPGEETGEPDIILF